MNSFQPNRWIPQLAHDDQEPLLLQVFEQCDNWIQNGAMTWEMKHMLVQRMHIATYSGCLFSQSTLLKIICMSKECLGGQNPQTTLIAVDTICKALEFCGNGLEESLLLDLSGKIFECLDVSSVDERNVLACLLHNLYFRNVAFRPSLRMLMGETMTQTSNQGIPEILNVLTLIIQGFTIPVREEHLVFCRMYLIPLLTHQNLPLFFENLRSALCEFVQRCPTIAKEIVSAALLQVCCDPMEDPMMHFDLAIDLLPSMTEEEFFTIQVLLYDRMARLMKTVEYAATAVRAFEDTTICGMIVKNIAIAQRMLLPALQIGILTQIDPEVSLKCFQAMKIVQDASTGVM